MIRSTLANLRGGGSLANELIQNADDADGARRLVFRFTADYLEVSDDGGFRACQQPNDPDECPWELAGRRACDFHAFRELGGASKADDPSLTGAFGIGFLAVYQITDHPELFSRGIHWILDEENEVVNVCDGCDEAHITTGTTFRLPWAKRRTHLREALGAEPVSAADRRRLLRQLIEQVPHAMIFLRKLREIEITDETSTIARFTRSVNGETVGVDKPAIGLLPPHRDVGQRGEQGRGRLRELVDPPSQAVERPQRSRSGTVIHHARECRRGFERQRQPGICLLEGGDRLLRDGNRHVAPVKDPVGQRQRSGGGCGRAGIGCGRQRLL